MSIHRPYRLTVPLACAVLLALASCGTISSGKRDLYDGVPFKAKARAIDKKADRALFSVEIKDAQRSTAGARQAAAHAGTKYCIEYYGTSRIDWVADPADETAPLTLSGGDALFQGTCNP